MSSEIIDYLKDDDSEFFLLKYTNNNKSVDKPDQYFVIKFPNSSKQNGEIITTNDKVLKTFKKYFSKNNYIPLDSNVETAIVHIEKNRNLLIITREDNSVEQVEIPQQPQTGGNQKTRKPRKTHKQRKTRKPRKPRKKTTIKRKYKKEKPII
jgi:hypothetical protein